MEMMDLDRLTPAEELVVANLTASRAAERARRRRRAFDSDRRHLGRCKFCGVQVIVTYESATNFHDSGYHHLDEPKVVVLIPRPDPEGWIVFDTDRDRLTFDETMTLPGPRFRRHRCPEMQSRRGARR